MTESQETQQVSEAQIAVHWREEEYYQPPESFVRQANAADPVLSQLSEEDRATLVAEPEDGALRFDIRMQGDRATVFFAV